ncbi:MAG TPA: hypothetical protein PKY77_05490 [Phycisphaerae bacterium]|nr:hypothetical protein [Phycisphaerae bacterium]HRY68967.1 hypothetical protein [Phycisphaerae bacterium]HSA25794.1 hypothetical protein [Phycisphaerae bacterium]
MQRRIEEDVAPSTPMIAMRIFLVASDEAACSAVGRRMMPAATGLAGTAAQAFSTFLRAM